MNDLVEQKVDILFVTNQVAIRAARKTTKTIPIVIVSRNDPVVGRASDPICLRHTDTQSRGFGPQHSLDRVAPTGMPR